MSIHPLDLRHPPKRLPLAMSLAALAGLLTGCGHASRTAAPATAQTAAPATHTTPPPAATSPATDNDSIRDGATLSVEQVVAWAARRNPNQALFTATRAAVLAEVQIAQAWANPELEVAGGQGRSREGGGTETIYGGSLRQRLELPGKRSARIAAARAGQAATAHEIAIDRLDLEVAVRSACLDLAAAEAELALEQRAFAAAEQLFKTVGRLHQAQEAEPGEYARAKLEKLTATTAREQAERQVAGLRGAIRIWAGDGLPEHFTVTDAMPAEPPAIDRQGALTMAAERHPRLALLRSRMDVRTAELTREQRTWQPDFTVGVFSDHEFDADNLGLSLGMEIPLWNRNQGGIALADAQQRMALGEWHAEQRLIAREVGLAWQRYDSRRLALGANLRDATDAAQAAVDAQLAGLAVGETSLIALLEARRAARSVQQSVVAARFAAADARLALGRAVGSFALTSTTSLTPAAGDQP